MAVFVIVHGGFGGGWEWADVARDLRARNHEVFTPTLTGMGERSHLGPRVGLTTQVEDVVAVLEFEDLHNVVLCGASYGGMVVTGAAIRLHMSLPGPVPKAGSIGNFLHHTIPICSIRQAPLKFCMSWHTTTN